jgi:hypothetical protein
MNGTNVMQVFSEKFKALNSIKLNKKISLENKKNYKKKKFFYLNY